MNNTVSSRISLPKVLRAAGLLLLHIPPVTLLFIPTRPIHWIAFGLSYIGMQFAICGGMHRFFAHRSFETSRAGQFFMGLMASACFGDPIGFSGRHRLHHKHSDTGEDFHGPHHGVWFGWIGHLLEDGFPEDQLLSATPDLASYPELIWLHRYSWAPGLAAAGLFYWIGGYAMLAVGYCLTWCIVVHGCSAVNYFCHMGTNPRYETGDFSTNNVWLALMMFGEGWHNNHHHYPRSARAGFFWYEIDILYYILKALSWTGLIWKIHDVPQNVKFSGFVKAHPNRSYLL